MNAAINSSAMTDAQKTEHIKAVVLAECAALLQRHPFLLHTDLNGSLIPDGSPLRILGAGRAYYFCLHA